MSSRDGGSADTGWHPGVGELADEIAGVGAPDLVHHLAGCPECSARLAALTIASVAVARSLRADPEPEMPPAVAASVAEAIAEESRSRAARSSPSTTGVPGRQPVRSRTRRAGWWARHTRLGGALVTAAALVVVGGGGTALATWLGHPDSTNQATDAAHSGSGQEDAAAPASTPTVQGLGARTSPPSVLSGPVDLHRATFVGEVAGVLGAGTGHDLGPADRTCAADALTGGDLEDATLTAPAGQFTLDGVPVLVVVAAHDATRTAVAISGCGAPQAQIAARGDLP